MKNNLSAKVSAVALCAAACALAGPAHAQSWVFMQAQPQPIVPGANNGCSGGPTLTPKYPKVTMTAKNTSLAVASGGTGAQVVGDQPPYASYNYDQPFRVTYVWSGGGTPTPLCPTAILATLTANVTLSSLEAASATCGLDNTIPAAIAAAHLEPGSPPANGSDAHTYLVVNNYQVTGSTCQFDVSVNASAAGTVLVGMKYTATATASLAFK